MFMYFLHSVVDELFILSVFEDPVEGDATVPSRQA